MNKKRSYIVRSDCQRGLNAALYRNSIRQSEEYVMTMRTLYQFPTSHFCEKARWLLDHKQLHFVAKNITPGLHRPFVQWKAGKNTVPMLHDKKSWIADSTEIAHYLDEQYAMMPLLLRDPAHRAAAIEIDRLACEVGEHVRRWRYYYLLSQTDFIQDLIAPVTRRNPIKQAQPFIEDTVKAGLTKLYQLDESHATQSFTRLNALIELLEARLIANGGRYMVGHQLGLGDIATCSLMAPLLGPAGTPWDIHERHHSQNQPEVFNQYREQLSNRPIGQYILRIYATERGTRSDWRGQ